MLAERSLGLSQAPKGHAWSYEIKHDGFRTLLRIDPGNIRAFIRGGHDWSEFWLKTKNVVESELILLGTDYDNEGKPNAYLGREAEGELRFAGIAFKGLTG